MNTEVLQRPRASFEDAYRIIYKVGEGTFGNVSKAVRNDQAGLTVAVKDFKATAQKAGEGFPQSAIREIGLLRELRHDNIVRLIEVFIDPANHTLRLIYEYADHDLHRLSRAHGKEKKAMDGEMVRAIMYQLLDGLHYLHENWILHLDLKPANVLVTGATGSARDRRGTVQIADFGTARYCRRTARPLYETGVVVTLLYRAPELLLGSKHYTSAVDVWAVGCILAELLLWRPLFDVKINVHHRAHHFEDGMVGEMFSILGAVSPEHWPKCVYLHWWDKVYSRSDKCTLHTVLPDYDEERPMFRLLRRMLDYNPETRISAEEALNHEWFKGTLVRTNVFGAENIPYAPRPEYIHNVM